MNSMSVLINTATTSGIGNANVGTATTGDNTTKYASGAFILNAFNSFNYVLNLALSYTITGVKTFTNGFPLTAGTNPGFPITMGALRASIVDILPASNETQYINLMGQAQNTSSNYGSGTNVFRNPIVVKDANNRILNGTITATTVGATVTFSPSFATGTVPFVFITSSVYVQPRNTGALEVSHLGFKAYSTTNVTCNWFAIGQ